MFNPGGFPIRKIPLRCLLVVPFVLQIFAVVGLTGWVSLRSGQKAVNDLAAQLRNEVTARIEQKLSNHLETAPLVNQINIDAIRLGILNLSAATQAKTHIKNQLRQFPNLSGITIATEAPNYVGMVYDDRGLPVLTLWNHQQGGVIDYQLNQRGEITAAIPQPDYDHRKRPWYQAAVQAGQAIWQEPYITINPQRLVISADQPFYDGQGRLLGVADAELTLSNLSEFLANIRIGKTGQTFIVERDGELVATSTAQPTFRINPKTQEPERLLATESDNQLVRETSQFLLDQFGNLTQIDTIQQLDFRTAGDRMYVQVMPFHADQGLDWLVVVTVPEADFMETINANTRNTLWLCLGALGFATTVGLITSHWLIQPILGMVSAADALSKGNWNQHLPRSRFGELALLASAFNHMAEQLQMSFSALQYNAYHDALTGLLNQTAFRLRLQEAIARRNYFLQTATDQYRYFDRTGHTDGHLAPPSYLFAVLFMDLDYFKHVNDSLGHLAGDQLLVAVTRRLKKCLLEYRVDYSENAIARFGGDEFVILLDPVQDMTDATELADRIATELQKPFNLEGKEVFISTSIGIVMSPNGGSQPESFLRNADIALYRAKANGKSGYAVFDAQMHTDAVDRLQLEMDLRRAIEQRSLKVYYQPIVDTQTQQLRGFEALVRWDHPQQGWVAPQNFIPIAEETGLIVRLGWWLLEQACQQMRRWQQQFPLSQTMTMSVNVSSKQVFQSDFLQQLERILVITQLPPHCLKLEITESVLMHSDESTRSKLKRIKQLGIQLCIDDFGTGYSSLSYLYRFPIDTIKIDRSFIQQLDQRNNHLEIVAAIAVLAHKLGMNVVAEGVETPEQLNYLRQIGCEQVQGFLFSMPIAASQIDPYLTAGTALDWLNRFPHPESCPESRPESRESRAESRSEWLKSSG